MRYKAIFIDIDDTLLDYIPCCRAAFQGAIESVRSQNTALRVPLSDDELFSLFFAISGRLFSEAKHGLHTIAEVMELYPAEFIDTLLARAENPEDRTQDRGAMIDTFKHAFRTTWSGTHYLVPGARETLETLRNRGYRLFAASNSFGHLQRRRLEGAGILPYFEDLFISMDVGYDKPDVRFFEHALQAVNRSGAVDKSEALMVGDSMTTDILGAQKAGWATCFFHRRPDEQQPAGVADYEIYSLPELTDIL